MIRPCTLVAALACFVMPQPVAAQIVYDFGRAWEPNDGGAHLDFAMHDQSVVASEFRLAEAALINRVTFWGNEYSGWLDPGTVNWWIYDALTYPPTGDPPPGAPIISGVASTSRDGPTVEGSDYSTYRYSFSIPSLWLPATTTFYLALNASSPGSTGIFAWDMGSIQHRHLAYGSMVDGEPVFGGGVYHFYSGRFQLESVPTTVVPEPGTVALVLTGLIGLAVFGRLRRRESWRSL